MCECRKLWSWVFSGHSLPPLFAKLQLSDQNSASDSVSLQTYAMSCCSSCWSLLYSAILCSQADSLHWHVILHEWLVFYSVFLNIHWSGVLNSADTAGATWNCCHRGAFCVYHTTMHHVTSCKATYVRCLAVTCHLHFRQQNDWDLLRATVITWRWNGYQNKSQQRKLTLEKEILSLLLLGFKPTTFQSKVWCSDHWAIPASSLSDCIAVNPFWE